jgi:hypothetical protein
MTEQPAEAEQLKQFSSFGLVEEVRGCPADSFEGEVPNTS